MGSSRSSRRRPRAALRGAHDPVRARGSGSHRRHECPGDSPEPTAFADPRRRAPRLAGRAGSRSQAASGRRSGRMFGRVPSRGQVGLHEPPPGGTRVPHGCRARRAAD
ncbi:MAG: hypothetical protein ACK55I_33835, partial [bacterium]